MFLEFENEFYDKIMALSREYDVSPHKLAVACVKIQIAKFEEDKDLGSDLIDKARKE